MIEADFQLSAHARRIVRGFAPSPFAAGLANAARTAVLEASLTAPATIADLPSNSSAIEPLLEWHRP